MKNKKAFYASVFNYLLKMLNKYYTNGTIPFDERQEYDFIIRFNRELDELLQLGKCRVTAELYRILCGTIRSRQLPYCSNPKKLLCELWKIFAYWSDQPYTSELQNEMMETIDSFCEKWKDQDIAVELITLFATEAADREQETASVA